MSLETLTRSTRRLYEEIYLQGGRQLFHFLFPEEDMDTSSAFLLDEYVQEPYAISYRDKGGQSHIREYEVGSGTLYDIPRASEKTPIDETLRDASVEGVEVNGGFDTAQMRKTEKIMKDHMAGHNMTKNKQAMDVLRTGNFLARGKNSEGIGQDIEYNRIAANTLTYDFTAAGNNVDEALTNMVNAVRAQGCPTEGLGVIVGTNWQRAIVDDESVIQKMQTTKMNEQAQFMMKPPEFMGVEGLFYIGSYIPAGSLAPVKIFTYNPGVSYRATRGGTASDWIGASEAVIFSTMSMRYNVCRGVDVKDNNGNIMRAVGEVVFDYYCTDDPVAEFERSTTRHAFVPGNINHTAISTGTFS